MLTPNSPSGFTSSTMSKKAKMKVSAYPEEM
jgi:hypothetical protein